MKSIKSIKSIKGIKGQKLFALIIFVTLGFAALQVPINHLAGSKASFTMFDLFAPVSGAFLGSWFGIVAVFLMQLVNLMFHGFANFDKGTIIRLFPVLFGVWFFSKRSGNFLIIPLLAIISFNLNPIGRSVWYYSLFWTIPVFCYFLRDRSLFARALGAAFTAHAVGGALWIWAFNLPAAVWISLIPVVAMERLLFASGIAGVYVLLNNVLFVLSKKRFTPNAFLVNKKYVFLN